jgi:DNA-binding NtrC family response regulator
MHIACTLCDGDLLRAADLPIAVQSSAPEESRVVPGGRDETTFIEAPLTAGDEPGSLSPTAESGMKVTRSVALEPLKDFLREQEVNYLNRTLVYTAGNKEKAAELLGISLATLYRKLAEEPNGV